MKKLAIISSLLLVSSLVLSQALTTLPRSEPEAEGVSSTSLIKFIDAANNSGMEFHSYMILRHGKVIAEGWWNPYASEIKHTMYSVSKSFTATAVGFAVAEKKLSLEDKVVSFFPGELPDSVSPYLKDLTVKHLLTMSSGNDPEPSIFSTSNWVKAFLAAPIVNKPGSKFLYNTPGTFMLSAIVQKVTGEKIIDYLQPRLFRPRAISGIDWETSPAGENTGGYGLRLKTEDMAKFGQLFLQKGKWQGKQILPPGWVEEASTKKIEQEPNADQFRKDTSDWVQGYCYQMWRSRHNSYRADGAAGQFILVWPELDAVVITTAEIHNMQAEFNLIWQFLYPAFKNEKLPADPNALSELRKKSKDLALPVFDQGTSTIQPQIAGKTFGFATNDKLLKSISFTFSGANCEILLEQDSGKYSLHFGGGKWVEGATMRYGPYLVERAKGNRRGLAPFKVAGAYRWMDNNTLVLTLRYIESPHTETLVCKFVGDAIRIQFKNSLESKVEPPFYNGEHITPAK